MTFNDHIRPVLPADGELLTYLVQHAEYSYRHLDWRSPSEWLGAHPFLALEDKNQFIAALACPDDGNPIRWIRLFSYLRWNEDGMWQAWHDLFSEVQHQQDVTYAGLGLQPWFSEIMIKSGFVIHQSIVVLQWKGMMLEKRPLASGISLRPMQIADIDFVQIVDNVSFPLLWNMSHKELELALQQSNYAVVAELDGEIIGYQICTGNLFHAHLARLAVHPDLQRLSIGYALVYDLLRYFAGNGIDGITVNTQSDNHASLSLYEKAGFQPTGETFPVYTYSSS